MTWITLKNLNSITESILCSVCMEKRFRKLKKHGTLVDSDLIFLTYIEITPSDSNVIEIGSYPFCGSEVVKCENCNNYYLKYFKESGHAGRFEFRLISHQDAYSTKFASTRLTLDQEEFKFLESIVACNALTHKHTYQINQSDLVETKAINLRLIGDKVNLALVGERKHIHQIINQINSVNAFGHSRAKGMTLKKIIELIESIQIKIGTTELEDEIKTISSIIRKHASLGVVETEMTQATIRTYYEQIENPDISVAQIKELIITLKTSI